MGFVGTYGLFPGPVSRHKIVVTPLLVLKLAVRDVVNAASQVRIGKDLVDDLSRVAVPDLMISGHPLGRGSVCWMKAIVPGSI